MLLLAGLMKLGEKENPEKWLQIGVYGVPGEIRTPGLSLRRRSLYPAELRKHFEIVKAKGGRRASHLGGGRSILLSYGNICGNHWDISPCLKTHLMILSSLVAFVKRRHGCRRDAS